MLNELPFAFLLIGRQSLDSEAMKRNRWPLASDANVIYIQVPAIVGGLKACNCLRFVSINTGYYLLGTRQPLVSAMVYDLRF